MTERKGMTRLCPICGERLAGITTDWTLEERKIAGHAVATMGTTWNCPAHLVATVEFQMASNLAAYDLNYDAELNLGWMGTAWVQCPSARERVTGVCWAR